jgi:hypothetical protein
MDPAAPRRQKVSEFMHEDGSTEEKDHEGYGPNVAED